MEEYIEEPIKVYIETDSNNNIIKIFSSDFEQPTNTSIKIDEGFGIRYRHAQNNYFAKPLKNEYGSYNYSFIGGKIIEK